MGVLLGRSPVGKRSRYCRERDRESSCEDEQLLNMRGVPTLSMQTTRMKGIMQTLIYEQSNADYVRQALKHACA